MRLKGSVKKDDFNKLKKEEQEHYELLDGTDIYVLKEGETENVDGLKSALNQEREQSTRRQQALEKFKDVDPEKYATLIKEEQELARQREQVATELANNNKQWEEKI